jgi:hypothetical protein
MNKAELRALVAQAQIPVTGIPKGHRTINESEFKRAEREDRRPHNKTFVATTDEQTLIDEHHTFIDHKGVVHVRNGLGE